MNTPERSTSPEHPRVYHWRRAKGLSLRDAADVIGIAFKTLHRCERAERPPRFDQAEKIGRVTEQTAGEVITEVVHIMRRRSE